MSRVRCTGSLGTIPACGEQRYTDRAVVAAEGLTPHVRGATGGTTPLVRSTGPFPHVREAVNGGVRDGCSPGAIPAAAGISLAGLSVYRKKKPF